jgi:hypothetical protein
MHITHRMYVVVYLVLGLLLTALLPSLATWLFG